jgi:hypothetical protein
MISAPAFAGSGSFQEAFAMSSLDSSVSRRCPPNTRYSPTHDEIWAECARIRAGWNESEYHKRAGLSQGRDLLELVPVVFGVLEGQR